MASLLRTNVRPPRLLSHPATSMRLSSTLRKPREPPYRIPFDQPLTLDSLSRIAKLLPHTLFDGARELEDPSLTNEFDNKTASVLLALCNVDNVPGVLLEVRGKLRTHSGEIRRVSSVGKRTLRHVANNSVLTVFLVEK